MKEIVNKFTIRSILISLCLAALGIIIIINANDVMFWVIKVLGALLIIDAVIRFIQFLRLKADERSINFDIIRAIIEAVIGIVAIVNTNAGVMLLYIFIGVIVVVEGILHLQFVLTRKKRLEHWMINFFIAVINILCGVFIIAHPILTNTAVSLLIGIEILVSSFFGICSYIYLYAYLKRPIAVLEDVENDDEKFDNEIPEEVDNKSE